MSQPVMKEYRIRKLEEEYFAKSTFKKRCELILKHGEKRSSYWATPEVVKQTRVERDGHSLTATTIWWRTKRDREVSTTILLPDNMTLQTIANPCKYMETDHGYQNVISLVIGGLIAMNMLNFWLTITMADLGVEAFSSPFFIGPFCAIIGMIIAAMRFNQTFFTFRFILECYEPDKEKETHLCYAVDTIPVHMQLMLENIPEIVREALVEHPANLDETYADLRITVAEKDDNVDRILRDRRHHEILNTERSLMMDVSPSMWSNPMVIGLVLICITLVGLLLFVVAGGQ